jgi:hypothetical protein
MFRLYQRIGNIFPDNESEAGREAASGFVQTRRAVVGRLVTNFGQPFEESENPKYIAHYRERPRKPRSF